MVAEVYKALAALKTGTPIVDVSASFMQFAARSEPLSRSGDGTLVLNDRVAEATFGGGAGYFGAATNANGDHVVFQVAEIIPAEADTASNLTSFVAQTRQGALFSDFMRGLRETTGMTVNRKVLSQLLALGTTGN